MKPAYYGSLESHQWPTAITTSTSTQSASFSSVYNYILTRVTWRSERTVLVSIPDHWITHKDILPFIALIKQLSPNPNSGCDPLLLISGRILVVDPEIETRTISEFWALLKTISSVHEEVDQLDQFLKERNLYLYDSVSTPG